MNPIIVCPPIHKPIYYGKCPACDDWFTIRKNGRLRQHKDCPERSLYRDALEPIEYAVICVKDRHDPRGWYGAA